MFKFGRKVVWLEDYDGKLYLTTVKGTVAYIYPRFKIGKVTLRGNGTTGGDALYVKLWKLYKPGKPYRRPAQRSDPKGISPIQPRQGLVGALQQSAAAGAMASVGTAYEGSLWQAYNALQQQAQTPQPPETDEDKVKRYNREMMQKLHPNQNASNLL